MGTKGGGLSQRPSNEGPILVEVEGLFPLECLGIVHVCGDSTQELPNETHGHINSAGCKGMAETVTTAHHAIWRHLQDSMHAAKKQESKLEFATLDKESNMSTLWEKEEFFKYVQQAAGVGKSTRS